MRKQSGFTLIEVMIVAAIIALLAGIGLPSFQDNRTYDGGPCPANTKYFTYECVDDASTYTIKATGKDSTAGFVFTINQANTKATTSAPSGWDTSASCWITRKGDSC